MTDEQAKAIIRITRSFDAEIGDTPRRVTLSPDDAYAVLWSLWKLDHIASARNPRELLLSVLELHSQFKEVEIQAAMAFGDKNAPMREVIDGIRYAPAEASK